MRRLALVVALALVALAGGAGAAHASGGALVAYEDRIYDSDPNATATSAGGALVTARNGRSATIARRGSGNSFYGGRGPRWSPDGRFAAYGTPLSAPPGGAYVTVVRADGRGTRRIATGVGFVNSVAWSPDGRRIAWVGDDKFRGDPYVTRRDGRGRTRLTNHGDVETVFWSRRGQIAYERESNESCNDVNCGSPPTPTDGTWVMDDDGGGQRRLPTDEVFALLDFSPDGSRMLFGRRNESVEEMDLYVAGANGRGLDRLPFTALEAATWAPDGRIGYLERDLIGSWSVVLRRTNRTRTSRVRLPNPRIDVRSYIALDWR